MHWLLHVSGITALFMVCGVLFIEECGVPLPVLPGDGLLVVGGILVASGRVPALMFFPVATLAMCSGALVGHAWSGAVGGPLLRRLAARLNATRHFEAARSRLIGVGPWGVLFCRLVPGLRVYTNLAAGAAGVSRRTFLLGLVPSVLVWVIGFGALGILVGRPVERFLLQSRGGFLLTLLLLALLVATLIVARHLPARRSGTRLPDAGAWRISIAVLLDIGVCATAGTVAAEMFEQLLPAGESLIGVAVVAAAGAMIYVATSRRTGGRTAGEGLLHVSYRRRPRL